MLKFNSNHYVFPDINYYKSLNNSKNPKNEIKLTKLNWDYSEGKKRGNYSKWQTETGNTYLEFVPSLPDNWNDFLNNQVFSMNQETLDEIRFHVNQGIDNSDRKKLPYIHENFTFESTTKSFEIAFRILADCLYDEEKMNWANDSKKSLVASILLYKFWAHQIKYSEVLKLSLIDKLKEKYLDEYEKTDSKLKEEYFKKYNNSFGFNFLEDIEKHNKQLINSYTNTDQNQVIKLNYEIIDENRRRCRVKIPNVKNEYCCGQMFDKNPEETLKNGDFQYQYGYAIETRIYPENIIEPVTIIEFDKIKPRSYLLPKMKDGQIVRDEKGHTIYDHVEAKDSKNREILTKLVEFVDEEK